MLKHRASRGHPALSQRGLSLVELMVGVAVGLFVVAGATMLVANQLGDNRRLLLETQIQQDLRAAADIVARDIRRSGYWGSAQTGVWYAGSPGVTANPYTTLAPAVSGAAASSVAFNYSRGVENNAIDAIEQSGFQLVNGVIQMRVGGNWQPLTDDRTLRITNFQATMTASPITLSCFLPCGAMVNCPPTQTVREVEVVIEGRAVVDANVRRSVRSNVRLRNDLVAGACPT
jgi:type IV pilus assembly protein PilW